MSYNPFAGVTSFNGRQGVVTLSYSDVTGALGFTPTTVSGAVSGVAAAVIGIIYSNGSALSAASAGSGISISGGVISSNVILAASFVGASLTGTLIETTLATITVPGNTMGANGRIEIETIWSFTNSANNKTARVKFGGTTLQNIVLTTNNSMRTSCFIANRNNTASQVAPPNSSTGSGATTNAIITAAIDTTSSVSITITGQLANTGETITLEGYIVRLYR